MFTITHTVQLTNKYIVLIKLRCLITQTTKLVRFALPSYLTLLIAGTTLDQKASINSCQLIKQIFLLCWGFWPAELCPSKELGVTAGTVYRIFNLSCDPLFDLPEKRTYLRQYHQHYLIGSNATYDCLAGHQFENGVRQLFFYGALLRRASFWPLLYRYNSLATWWLCKKWLCKEWERCRMWKYIYDQNMKIQGIYNPF